MSKQVGQRSEWRVFVTETEWRDEGREEGGRWRIWHVSLYFSTNQRSNQRAIEIGRTSMRQPLFHPQ